MMMMTRSICLLVPFAAACGTDPEPPRDPVPVTLTLKDPGGQSTSNAAFVAVRDGDGDWQELIGEGGVYATNVTSNRFGVWIGCIRPSGNGVSSISYRTIAEGTELFGGSCAPFASLPLTISGAVTSEPADDIEDYIEVWSLDSVADVFEGAYEVASSERAQLLASRRREEEITLLRLDLGTLGADTVRDLDFADGQPPERSSVRVSNLQPEDTFLDTLTGVHSSGGAMYLPGDLTFVGEPTSWFVLPATMRLPDDMIESTVFAGLELGGSRFDKRSAGSFGASPPFEIALPDPVDFGDATIALAPFSIAWTLPELAIADGDELEVRVSGGTQDQRSAFLFVTATAGWAAESSELEIPEPAGIAGTMVPVADHSWSIEHFSGEFPGDWTSAGRSGSERAQKRLERPRSRTQRPERLTAR